MQPDDSNRAAQVPALVGVMAPSTGDMMDAATLNEILQMKLRIIELGGEKEGVLGAHAVGNNNGSCTPFSAASSIEERLGSIFNDEVSISKQGDSVSANQQPSLLEGPPLPRWASPGTRGAHRQDGLPSEAGLWTFRAPAASNHPQKELAAPKYQAPKKNALHCEVELEDALSQPLEGVAPLQDWVSPASVRKALTMQESMRSARALRASNEALELARSISPRRSTSPPRAGHPPPCPNVPSPSPRGALGSEPLPSPRYAPFAPSPRYAPGLRDPPSSTPLLPTAPRMPLFSQAPPPVRRAPEPLRRASLPPAQRAKLSMPTLHCQHSASLRELPRVLDQYSTEQSVVSESQSAFAELSEVPPLSQDLRAPVPATQSSNVTSAEGQLDMSRSFQELRARIQRQQEKLAAEQELQRQQEKLAAEQELLRVAGFNGFAVKHMATLPVNKQPDEYAAWRASLHEKAADESQSPKEEENDMSYEIWRAELRAKAAAQTSGQSSADRSCNGSDATEESSGNGSTGTPTSLLDAAECKSSSSSSHGDRTDSPGWDTLEPYVKLASRGKGSKGSTGTSTSSQDAAELKSSGSLSPGNRSSGRGWVDLEP